MFCWCQSNDVFILVIYNEDFNTIKIQLNKAKWNIQRYTFKKSNHFKPIKPINLVTQFIKKDIINISPSSFSAIKVQILCSIRIEQNSSWTSLWIPRVNRLRWQSLLSIYFLHCNSFSFYINKPLEVNIHP